MEEHKSIDELVIRVDERNIDESISVLIGVSIDKCFIKSVANVNGTDLSKYKIIRKDDFAVSLMQVSRDGKIPVAKTRTLFFLHTSICGSRDQNLTEKLPLLRLVG